MDEELQNQEQVGNETVETTATPTTTEENVVPEQPQERTYTKAEVQSLMKKRVERSHKAFFTRYGVEDLNALDDLMNKSKAFGEDYASIQTKNKELMREIAFLKNNINPEKYDDIIAYFKGSDIEFDEEQLIEALKTHPEWLKTQPQNVTTIQKMGNEFHEKPSINDREKASKYLGVKL